nr:hypothetical protein [Yoonia sp.]
MVALSMLSQVSRLSQRPPARNHSKRALFEVKLLHRLRDTPQFNFTNREIYSAEQEKFR